MPLRFLTAGESHGPALSGILEGMPAGVPVSISSLQLELARRRLGFGRSPRMNFEQDTCELLGGIRFGVTLGSPIALVIRNTEWPAWQQAMGIDAPEDIQAIRSTGRGAILTRPRPGHADLVGMQKYDRDDARDILERSSARETAMRVGLGYFAKALLGEFGIRVFSHVTRIGQAVVKPGYAMPTFADLAAIDASPVRCIDEEAAQAMIKEVEQAKANLDTLGGNIEILVEGLPPGLGSHVHYDRKLDAQLAQAVMSVQAIKAVGFGVAQDHAVLPGSQVHDTILSADNWDSNRDGCKNGGVEGGMSTGQVLRIQATMKPLASLMRPMPTVDLATHETTTAITQRSDVCAVPRAGVVLEAAVALVVAKELIRKTGGDSLKEMQANLANYLAGVTRKRGQEGLVYGDTYQGDPVTGSQYLTPELQAADHGGHEPSDLSQEGDA